jgi:hypothetical protein
MVFRELVRIIAQLTVHTLCRVPVTGFSIAQQPRRLSDGMRALLTMLEHVGYLTDTVYGLLLISPQG